MTSFLDKVKGGGSDPVALMTFYRNCSSTLPTADLSNGLAEYTGALENRLRHFPIGSPGVVSHQSIQGIRFFFQELSDFNGFLDT